MLVLSIVNVTAFLIGLFFLSYRWKESLVETLPAVTCMLVLTLYVLALFRRLSLIDAISLLVVLAFLAWLVKSGRDKRAGFGKVCLENMTHASFIIVLILFAVVILAVSQKVVTWWDDINFWAADVKSLYYLDGFAAKYGNVAPEFGDYPPGAQLMKWWFLHLDPGTFREGLAFAGYYVMNIVFMLPMLRRIKGRNVLMIVFMAAALWFFPSIAEVYGYDGFCADLTMACIYGGFLFAVTEKKEHQGETLYYGRLCLYLSVLVLVKSVGFIWAFFGLVFLGCNQWITVKKEQPAGKKIRFQDMAGWKFLTVCAAPLITGGSWMLFCLCMRRITRTTTTAVKYMTTDEYGISGYTGDYAKAFLEAFIRLPLHKEKSIAIDLSPLGLYLCICLLVIFLFRKNIMPKSRGKLVLWHSIISGALFYGIIFLAHITIFATETQYLEASGMISSIERYGAPFTVGTLLFLADIWMTYGDTLFQEKKNRFVKQYGTCLCLLLFVALTAGYRTGYHGLIGYHSEVQANLSERADMIDEDAKLFLEAIAPLGTKESKRVFCIQRDDTPRWVKNSYTNLEASPISVVYKSVNLDDAATDWMVQEIRDSHASYLYVENTDADTAEVFDEITRSGQFSCERLYSIVETAGELALVEAGQADAAEDTK